MNESTSMKRVIAWTMLILLIIIVLLLSYIKFFGSKTPDIQEIPVENSSSEAIHSALKEIVTNFNNRQEEENLENENAVMKAVVNQYSIFISYTTDITITYEFSYHNLELDINVEDNEENLKVFKSVYGALIQAVQKRLGNTADLQSVIDSIFEENAVYDGIVVSKKENNMIHFQMDITKKINSNKEENLEEEV